VNGNTALPARRAARAAASGGDEADRIAAAFGDNDGRLAALEARVNQSIAPAAA
jgi:hypothetical protein